jgi:hypothetical protein
MIFKTDTAGGNLLHTDMVHSFDNSVWAFVAGMGLE